MNRDTVKTLAGLVIIGGIVVATFMYGNAQRQAQLNRDSASKSKKQVVAKTSTPAPTRTATPSPTPTHTPLVAVVGTPKPTAAPTPQATANTAPVKSPTSSSLQGTGGAGATLGATASPTPKKVPDTGGSALPQTGPGTMGLIGFSLIGAMVMMVRGSRRAVVEAARVKR